MLKSVIFLVLCILPSSLGRPFSHEQQRLQPQPSFPVARLHVTSPGEIRDILEFSKSRNYDVWTVTNNWVDIRLDTTQLPSSFASFNASLRVIQPPYQHPDQFRPNPSLTCSLESLHSPVHNDYHRFEDVIEYANELARTFPLHVELVRMGQSTESREILGIKIERPGGRKVRPRVIILGPQHARDWIATSTALYFAHTLVVSSDQGGSMNHLLNKFAFTIVPIPNPDGYVHTWDVDRLWYKNRSPTKNEGCVGIDMNRNWGQYWKTSDDPCHHWYGGSGPFEAPEVNAIASYIERTSNIRILLDLRSYGQMLMYPYSYSCDTLPPNAENLIELALGASKASKSVHGVSMITGAACEVLYSAPGSVLDWAYSEAGVKFTYSISLRDTGTYGYLLPPQLIRPVGEETSALIEYIANWVAKVSISAPRLIQGFTTFCNCRIRSRRGPGALLLTKHYLSKMVSDDRSV
ncbi:uncharacterized protein EI90DRAFT_3156418 [Cantharellus anzutake]|uniref:uncharacterized protein n=1 Tax=Cantharellus anzutake TaxID=1750568 RepID=UPI001906DEC3|nr:uncharacterized protein EI90DRAFT_3156418 [Cantharellus anzutake]KAF8326827.1 hypothetical protein EI90DRAFT_3156418 [Cantharellus anzutake]